MPLFDKLRQYFRPSVLEESEPAAAYDIWALNYDNQPDNLMLALDEKLCSDLLAQTTVTGRIVADIGCGTGRHWNKLFDQRPGRLIGYDVSQGMLDQLRHKYPHAETHQLDSPRLAGLANDSCDLVLSTLTIAHIPDLQAAFTEWYRVLRPGGEMIFTDYHPTALAKGGQRTFREGDSVIAVRNHIYPVSQVRHMLLTKGMRQLRLEEYAIDDTMRPYYEKQQALAVFQRFRGVPIIYGIHLKKPDAAH